MSYEFVAPIDNLKIAKEANFQFAENGFLYHPDEKTVFDKFNYPEFLNRVGEINSEKIFSKHCLYTSGEYPELAKLTGKGFIGENLPILMNWFHRYVHALWFVKDNSCQVSTGFIRNGPKENVMSFSIFDLVTSSDGDRNNSVFSYEELKYASEINLRLSDFLRRNDVVKNEKKGIVVEKVEEPMVVSGAQYYAKNDVVYGEVNQNRIARANDILIVARANPDLVQKISFYVATLECLFSTFSEELKYRIAQRATLYLGGDKETMENNNKTFKTAYNIRSSFFHGGVQKLKKEALVELSAHFDQLLREIFIRIIYHDSEHFLMKQDKMDEWFEDQFYSKAALSK